VADHGGDYEFMLGLMTNDTKYTSEEVQGAIDEIQTVTLSSEYLPDIQVNTGFPFSLKNIILIQ